MPLIIRDAVQELAAAALECMSVQEAPCAPALNSEASVLPMPSGSLVRLAAFTTTYALEAVGVVDEYQWRPMCLDYVIQKTLGSSW